MLETGGGEQRARLKPGQTFIVPKGVWHRGIVNEPGQADVHHARRRHRTPAGGRPLPFTGAHRRNYITATQGPWRRLPAVIDGIHQYDTAPNFDSDRPKRPWRVRHLPTSD